MKRASALSLFALFLPVCSTWAGAPYYNNTSASKKHTPAPICVEDKRTADDRPRRDKHSEFKDKVEVLEKKVSELRKRLEEWGSVTVSAPIIMREAGEFNLGKESDFPNALQYINLALTSAQGGVSQSTSTAFSNQLDLTVTPTFSIDPLSGAKVTRTNTDGSLTPDTVANGTAITLTDKLAPGTPGGTAGTFAPPGSLIVGPNGSAPVLKPGANGTPTFNTTSSFMLSGSQAAMIGTNAKISEMLMRTMADPPQRLFTNPAFQLHFAIVQVSCNPGWRTRENYIADVSATCEYFDTRTTDEVTGMPGKVLKCPGRSPLVFSVLPLIDAQTLELQNSERRLTQLAASLSAAYPTAAANLKGRDLIQFVKQFQKDTQTVTPRTVANSYSAGSTFGFRLMPSLTALKDPARSGSKPANILQATSFPVLVTVVVSKKDVLELGANSVRVSIANRWLINDRPPFKEVWRRIGLPMWRERTGARVDLAMDFDEAREELIGLHHYIREFPTYSEAEMTLERDLDELRNKILGVSNPVFCLPASKVERFATREGLNSQPVIQRVIPHTLTPSGKASLFIDGLNLFTPKGHRYVEGSNPADEDPNIQVWLGQVKGTVRMASGDDQLVVDFDGLDQLAGMDSASLIVKTSFGAAGWGHAISLTPSTPAGNGGGIAKVDSTDPIADKADDTATKPAAGGGGGGAAGGDNANADASASPATPAPAKPTKKEAAATATPAPSTTEKPADKPATYHFTLIVTGSGLTGAKFATLSSDTVKDVSSATVGDVIGKDGTTLLIACSKVPEAALGQKVTLKIFDGPSAGAKLIASTSNATLPPAPQKSK